MKKLLCIIVLAVIALPLSAQDFDRFRIDAGAGLSFAMIDGNDLTDDEEFADAAGLFLSLLSLRGGFNGTFRFHLTESLSAGAELGVYTMSVSDTDGTGNSYTFIDIPLRGVVRFGKGSTFIQAFGGYYLSVDNPLFGGVEAGGKLSLGGLYVAASYTMGDITFIRYEIGYNLANILSF
ncbi:MAG: hypothetical protein JXB03_10270 [Spirochaetales bacterium]|nr:hypothetical protein [Spirochaetales bacterium]